MSIIKTLEAGWSTLSPSDAYKAHKAMSEYKKIHPSCEISGTLKDVQVHHIIPVWANPALASDKTNMISLSTSVNVHLLYGHSGNFRTKYVSNIKDIANMIVDSKKLSVVENRIDVMDDEKFTIKSFINWLYVKILRIFFNV